jgi:hypothetical protein
MFIALAIQSTIVVRGLRYGKGESKKWLEHMDSFLMVSFIMIYAEYTSLRDVYYGRAGTLDPAIIALALLTPAVIFIWEYSLSLLGAEKYIWEKLNRFFLIVMVLFIVLIFLDSWKM